MSRGTLCFSGTWIQNVEEISVALLTHRTSCLLLFHIGTQHSGHCGPSGVLLNLDGEGESLEGEQMEPRQVLTG